MDLISNNAFGLRRVSIKDLEPDLDNILIIAIIIGKQTPRKFLERGKENEYRAVWNFTLRDSQRDYINASYWGRSEDVCATSEKLYTGDVVEIRNPRIQVRRFNESGDQYNPVVTSPFFLILNEHSHILPYEGNAFTLTKLLHFPTKPLTGYVPLRDVNNGGENMKDRTIDILGAIRKVADIKTIKTKMGREIQMREIILFDHTSSALRVAIWNTEIMNRATNWKPQTTILFITDAKILWSSFLNSYSASLTSRSIVTESPIGQEAISLATYAKNALLDPGDIFDHFIMNMPNPESIQNVMCVKQVLNKINTLTQNAMLNVHITALMFVVITNLDLDGPNPVTKTKCSSCRSYIKKNPPTCENQDCSMALSSAQSNLDHSFDLKVNLSDHTGTLTNCRLSGSVAEQILDCTVQQFLCMTDAQKCEMKWKLLLERCAVRIVVLLSNGLSPRVSILTCTRVRPTEAIQKIPLC